MSEAALADSAEAPAGAEEKVEKDKEDKEGKKEEEEPASSKKRKRGSESESGAETVGAILFLDSSNVGRSKAALQLAGALVEADEVFEADEDEDADMGNAKRAKRANVGEAQVFLSLAGLG